MTQSGRLPAKVALLAGATGGIGQVAAEMFAAQCTAVVVGGRRRIERLIEARSENKELIARQTRRIAQPDRADHQCQRRPVRLNNPLPLTNPE